MIEPPSPNKKNTVTAKINIFFIKWQHDKTKKYQKKKVKSLQNDTMTDRVTAQQKG